MRILFLLLVICLFKQTGLPQPPRPSQKQVQAHVQEAQREARNMITDLESQIAEAKLNGEDQERITELENRLATVKKMEGVIAKAGTAPNTRVRTLPEAKRDLPRYVSPIVRIHLKQPVVTPTQKEANDQLLWYKGKKIDANTLVTTKGMIVRYERQNNRIILQPDERVDTPGYINLAKVLAQTEKFKNDFVVGMDKIDDNSFFMFPEILKAYNEFDLVRDRYYDLAKNSFQLTPIDDNGLMTASDYDTKYEELLAMHEALKRMMERMPEITRENLPPTPERPHDLCSCDETRRKEFESEIKFWPALLYKEEEELRATVTKMWKSEKDLKNSGYNRKPIPNWNAVIFKAQRLAIERERTKLELLTERYEQENNIYKEEGLVYAAASFKADLDNLQEIFPEDKSLKSQGSFRVQVVKDILFKKKLFEKYIEDQKTQRNYNVVFDHSLYVSHEESKQLMELGYVLQKDLFDIWMEGLTKFNRFTLNLTMDFELHYVDKEDKVLMTADGFLESDEIIVRLGRFECKWKLYREDANHKDRTASEEKSQIPIKVMQGKKDYLEDKKDPFFYSGPGHLQMVFPSVQISFCKDGSGKEIEDVAYMDIMRYDDAALRAYPKPDYPNEYSTDMLVYANKMFLGVKEIDINQGNLLDIADKMVDIQGTTQMPSSTGHSTLDQQKMIFTTTEQKHKLQVELSETSHTGNTAIPFNASNNTHVLIQKTHDTVDPNDKDRELGIKLIRGSIILRVQHKPLP